MVLFVNIRVYNGINNEDYINLGKIDIQRVNSLKNLYKKCKNKLWEFKNFDFVLYDHNAEIALFKNSTNAEFIDFVENFEDDPDPTITIYFLPEKISSTGGS